MLPTSSWASLRRYRGRIAAGCLVLIVATSLGVVIPYLIGRGVEALVGGGPLVSLAGAVLALALVQAAARALGNLTINGAARDAEHDLRVQVFAHLVAMDPASLSKQKAGDLVSRLTSDLQALMMMWGTGIFFVFGVGCLMLFTVIAMVLIDPIMTAMALAPIPLVMVMSKHRGRRVKQLGTEASHDRGLLSSRVHEDFAGISVVKNFHLEEERSRHFARRASQQSRSALAMVRASLLYGPLTATLVSVGTVALLWRGGNAVIDGKLGLGALVQFNAYLAMLGFRIVTLAAIVPVFQQGAVAWNRISAVLGRQSTIRDGAGALASADGAARIELRGLSIAIDGTNVLHDVSLDLPPGTVTAFVGRVGSGKSTLVEAVSRLIEVPPGRVFIDGQDITASSLASVRGSIAYAPQHAFLFSATIAENIAFGIDAAAGVDVRKRVAEAARIAGLEPDLAALPAGLDTQVGERGITLSGGQRQRVALARAIASDRRILVLDDALSAVDTVTERRILDELGEAFRGRTVLVISHRVTVTTRAHTIVVLDRGRLADTGTHDELLARGGTYAEIYRGQLEESAA